MHECECTCVREPERVGWLLRAIPERRKNIRDTNEPADVLTTQCTTSRRESFSRESSNVLSCALWSVPQIISRWRQFSTQWGTRTEQWGSLLLFRAAATTVGWTEGWMEREAHGYVPGAALILSPDLRSLLSALAEWLPAPLRTGGILGPRAIK